MTGQSTDELVDQFRAFLAPGEIALAGAIVYTDHGREDEIALYETTLKIGDLVAGAAGVEDWYVYSGNDDPEFSSNQHQGRRIDDDGFVWECQHLLRDGCFDVVIYYEASAHEAAISAIRDAGYDVVGIRQDEPEDLT